LCGNLKAVALLLGIQLAFTNYCCFLSEWESRDKKNHYLNKLWPKRISLRAGEKNVFNSTRVLREKKFPRSFAHKAHGNFVEGLEKTGRGLEYVRNKFRNESDKKL